MLSGVWLNGTHISPYCAKEEDRMAAGLKSPYKVNFQAALKEMAEANSNLGVSCPRIMDLKFQLEGSLEVSEAKNKIKEEQRAEAVRRQLALADAKAEAEENALRRKMKMARQLRVSSKSGSLDHADGDAKLNGILNTNGSAKTKSATKLSNEDILRAIPDCVKEKAVQTAAALKAIRQKHFKHKPAKNKTDDMSESDALPVSVSVGASEEMWDFKIKDFIPSLSPTSFYPLSHSHAVSSKTSSSSSSSSSTHDSAVAVAVGGTDKRKWRDHSQDHHHNGRVSNRDAGNGEERARRMRLLELSRDTSGIAGIASNSDISGGSSGTNNPSSSSSNSLSSKTSASSSSNNNNNNSGEKKTSSSSSSLSSSSSSDNGGDCTLKNNARGEAEKEGDKKRVGRDMRNKRKRFQVTRYPPSGATVLIPPYLSYDALQYSTAATEVLVLEEEEEEVVILSPKARLTRPGGLTEKKMKTETDVSEDLYNGVTDVNGAPDDISLPQYW